EHEVARHAARRLGLGLVAGARPAGPWIQPVARVAGLPGEIRMGGDAAQRPAGVVVDVGGEAYGAAGPQRPRHQVERVGPEEAALAVAALRPGSGREDVDASQRAGRQRGKDVARVAAMEADIADPLLLDPDEQAGDAVLEGLAAEEQPVRMRAGFVQEM